MAKTRYVNTRFWRDNYVTHLKADARLLFLWAITNPATELCGAYEAPLKTIESETGLRGKRIEEIFAQLEAAGKMVYREGWVIVKNFAKHQNGTSTNIKKGAARSLNDCPDWVKDTVSNGIGAVSHLDLDLDLNPVGQPQPTGESEPPVREMFIGTATAELAKRMDLKTLPAKLDWQSQADWAFENGFTCDQFLECYDLLTKQHWRDGPVKPKHLTENLPNLEKLRKEIEKQPNGASRPNGGKGPPSNDPPPLAEKLKAEEVARKSQKLIEPPSKNGN